MHEIGRLVSVQISPVVLLVLLVLAIRLWLRDRSLLAGTLMALVAWQLINPVWYQIAMILGVRFGRADLVNLGSDLLMVLYHPVLWLILGTSLVLALRKR